MGLSNAEKKAAQRERAAAAGICGRCFREPVIAGLTICEDCNEGAKARVKRSRELAAKPKAKAKHLKKASLAKPAAKRRTKK